MSSKDVITSRFITIVQDEEGIFTLYWSDLLKVVIIGVEKLVNLIDKLYASKKIDYEEYRDVVKKLVVLSL